MALTTYDELKTSIANWLAKSNLSSYIPDFITLAEKRLNRELRLRAMETALDDDIASGVIPVPADYIEMKHAYIEKDKVEFLERKNAEWIYSYYPTRSSNSTPLFYAQEGGNFIFGPYPDSTYTVKGIYYKNITPLSDSNTTNWFITNAPDLLLYGSLVAAEPFLRNDQRVMLWEQMYQQHKAEVIRQDEDERLSGSSPFTTPA